MLDLILKNGTVIDGTKTPRHQADIGIQGEWSTVSPLYAMASP